MRDMDADGVVSDSSEVQEGDVENSPLGSDNVQSRGSAVGEQDIDRSYSPYVPHNALEAGTPTTTYTEIPQDATTGAVRSTRSPPPAYPEHRLLLGMGHTHQRMDNCHLYEDLSSQPMPPWNLRL